jgi:serine/threonine protein kinase
MNAIDREITEVREGPRQGTVIGQFRLGRLLGSGLSSEVYEAENLLAGKRCALKLFRRTLRLGPPHWGRFVHEAKLAAALSAKGGLVDVYSFVNLDGVHAAVLELVEGTTLRALVRKNAPLSRRSYVPLMRALCQALAIAHAHGLAHLHLHGGQALVSWRGSEPEVRLCDFGVRHLLPDPKEDEEVWAKSPESALTLSPEQARGASGDPRSDVYALSVLLYEMVTGKVPFLAETFAATLEQHVSEAPVPPSQLVSVSAELEATILRGLEKDPRKRIPSVEALLAALDPAAVTGQHALASGRHAAISPAASREIELSSPGEPAAGHALPSTTARPAPLLQPEKPRMRAWLLILLGVAVLAFAGVTAWVLLAKETPSRPAPPRRPLPPRRPAGAAPGAAVIAATPVAGRDRPGNLAARGVSRPAGFGVVEVVSTDAKAQVFIDGKFRGEGSSVSLNLASGPHRAHVVSAGRKSAERDFSLVPGQRLRLSF